MNNIFTWKDHITGYDKVTLIQSLFSGVTNDICVFSLPKSDNSGVYQKFKINIPGLPVLEPRTVFGKEKTMIRNTTYILRPLIMF